MRTLALLGLLALAACGADGPPLRPSAGLGLEMSPDGEAELGGRVGLADGALSLGVGL